MLNFHLDRFPVAVDPSEYAEVALVIEERLKRLPGSVALYALGGLSAPGISDLDRIVVVDRAVDSVSFGWDSLSHRQRYVAMHTPFVVDTETFRVHQWFAYLNPLMCLWGDPLAIDPVPVDAGMTFRLGVEHLVMMRVKLEKVLFTGRISVRPMLCELNNLHHDLMLAGITDDAAPTAWAVVGEVNLLRSNWWEMRGAEQVDRMLRLPPLAVRGIDEALAAFAGAPATANGRSLHLHGYWNRVALRSASQSESVPLGRTLSRLVARRSRRASELRWRLAQHQVPAPDRVIALLAEQSAGESEVLATRRRYITRYSEFMSSRPGWSRIGVAGSLYG